MSGNRRAAETRAQQLYASALAQKAADEQAALDARIAAQEANAQAANTQVAAQALAVQQNGAIYPTVTFGPQINFPIANGFGTSVIANGYAAGGNSFGGFVGPQNNTFAFPTYPGFSGYSGFAAPGGTQVIGYPTGF